MKLEFSRQIFKNLNIKFHQNPSNGSRVVLCGGTDGHDEVNSLFRNFANASKNQQNTLSLEATSKQWNDWQGREEEGYQK
jgi:hypothetical protein